MIKKHIHLKLLERKGNYYGRYKKIRNTSIRIE